ncbi:hypothetical protein BH23GEM10_BH23GEM10_08750 [soil metagenome]
MTTRTRRSGGSSTVDTAARQITELAQAFRSFSQNVPGLTVEVVGHVAGSRQFVHPVAGFHVRLPGEDGTGIELYVSSRYGELVRWRPGTGALRERFDVHIDDPGYGWGESTFPSARELAHDLVAYMQFNLDALMKG